MTLISRLFSPLLRSSLSSTFFSLPPPFQLARSSAVFRLSPLFMCILIAGCSSTNEIETSRPQTIDPGDREDRESTRQARLSVTLEQGETPLPEDIERFEFRISEVRLHQMGGDWIRLPSDVHQFALPLHRNARRTVLDARVPPVAYDSVALVFDQVQVRFGENAGAPLTAADDQPLRLALDLSTSLDAQAVLTLRFEPGASLRRTSDCRWFFVPVVRAAAE